jgi:CubicO group peptidase (beta-lactamase class C family)
VSTISKCITIPLDLLPPADNSDVVPVGSYAKPWTAVAIMQLVEQGRLSLTDSVATIVNPWLQQLNGTTLEKVGWGASIRAVTIEMLLHGARFSTEI